MFCTGGAITGHGNDETVYDITADGRGRTIGDRGVLESVFVHLMMVTVGLGRIRMFDGRHQKFAWQAEQPIGRKDWKASQSEVKIQFDCLKAVLNMFSTYSNSIDDQMRSARISTFSKGLRVHAQVTLFTPCQLSARAHGQCNTKCHNQYTRCESLSCILCLVALIGGLAVLCPITSFGTIAKCPKWRSLGSVAECLSSVCRVCDAIRKGCLSCLVCSRICWA